MHLDSVSFEKILSGQKTLEIRLNDEKRKLLKVDDIIEFENDDGEVLPCKITSLSYFATFADLFSSNTYVERAWGTTKEAAIKAMYTIYTPEQEKEFGVVAIGIEGV